MNHYTDVHMVGRHFRVGEVGKHKVQRHYTIANCLHASFYGKYLAALKGEKVDKEVFIHNDANGFSFTAKNYKIEGGLSVRLNESDLASTKYAIQGPMGRGLDIQKEGTHIAFSAGTGILVFVDLVAHLIRKNLKLLDANEDA